MKALDRPFTKIINGTMQFVIPVFQRDYSWTEAQCQQLWDDILQVADDGSDRGHFLGSVVYVATGDSAAGFTRWLLIDGQQRLTTLTLLLTALRDHITDIGWKGGLDDPTTERVDAYFLRNVQEEGDRQQKLVLRRHDQGTLEALLMCGEMPSVVSDNIRDNYEFFRERLADADPSAVYRGVARLVVVDVTLDRVADDPQLIFESLNSTGIDLSQSDLIRNFVLMRLPEKDQTRLYEGYWAKVEGLFRGSESTLDSFIRDYLALHLKPRKQEKASEVYQAFRRGFYSLKQKFGGLEETLSDILRFAQYHAAFSLGARVPKALAGPMSRLRRLVDLPAILIMRLYDCHDRLGILSETEFRNALELIESYVFRRIICGEQTRGYWLVFANLAYQIGDTNPLGDLMVGLARQRENYRFPSDEDFQRELHARDVYALRTCGFLLDRLENFESREPTDTSGYTIEHIMPQNEKLPPAWQEMLGPSWRDTQHTWLHRLGNLTLTGYNSTYSDRPFEEKKSIPGGFAESSVRLNKYVRDQERWTPTEMEQRSKELVGKAMRIWSGLRVDPALVEAAVHEERRELAKKRDVSKVKMTETARSVFEQLRAAVLSLDSDVLELAESKSVSYHNPGFFLEVLPRKRALVLLLALDYNEVEDPLGIASDATEKKFFVHASYEGGVALRVENSFDVGKVMPIVQQAHTLAAS